MEFTDACESFKKMCNSYRTCSEGCPLSKLEELKEHDLDVCNDFVISKPKEAVAIVEKWSAEHPVKSYLDVFKEAMKSIGVTYPSDEYIFDNICIEDVFNTLKRDCGFDCKYHWHSEYKLPIKGE